LIGELDLNTVALLEDELARTREQSPPSVIDLSELRFLDLVGLRALLRGVENDAAAAARLVGATGIVRRLIDVAHTLDSESAETAQPPFPAEPRTRIAAQHLDQAPAFDLQPVSTNGTGLGAAAASISPNGEPT
jgi:anti-anti-sigma factor